MASTRSDTLPRLVITLSGIVFLMGSIGMSLKVEPFYHWYYAFAWWPYILIAESFLALRGGFSLLYRSPRVFLSLLPLSVILWLVFEAFNFRIDNWHYVGVPGNPILRWAGYGLSYSTVLPAILVTSRILEFLGLFAGARIRPLRHPQTLYQPLMFTGLLLLLMPLLFPRYYFPFIWGGFLFLLEPILHRYGGRSLLGDWERGQPRAFLLLLCAGLACGFLWEAWNYWAGAKWFYTIPFAGNLRLFEMPLPGYLGFPPFAVQLYAMANFCYLVRDRIEAGNPGGHGLARTALILFSVVFILVVFHGIDTFTVVSFK